MEIKIDKHIPIPPRRSQKYPLLDLEIGDSFFVPDKTASMLSATIAPLRAQYPDRTFVARSVTENGVRGARLWRVE